MPENQNAMWIKGLACFCLLMFCVVLTFTMPSGESLLNGFLRAIGVSPSIVTGAGGILHTANIIMVVIFTILLLATTLYWREYLTKFKGLNPILRFLPLGIVALTLLVSNVLFSPSIIDRIYFSAMSNRSGAEATSFLPRSLMLSRDADVYTYSFTLANHGSDHLQFSVMLNYPIYPGTEVIITDATGQPKIFSIPPASTQNFRGEFAANSDGFGAESFSFTIFLITIIHEENLHSPRPLIRHEGLVHRR